MKKGIHLGPPLARPAFASTLAVVVLAASSVVLGALTYGAYREVVPLRLEVSRALEGASAPPPAGTAELSSEQSNRSAAIRLRSVLQSGLLASTFPTDALGAVVSALPDGVVLTSLSLKPSPPNPGLLLEALAVDAERVTELQRRITRSPLVSATRLLEERRSVDGKLAVRLQVDLSESSR
jgi:Fimbrial assembly protein (PilN)